MSKRIEIVKNKSIWPSVLWNVFAVATHLLYSVDPASNSSEKAPYSEQKNIVCKNQIMHARCHLQLGQIRSSVMTPVTV